MAISKRRQKVLRTISCWYCDSIRSTSRGPSHAQCAAGGKAMTSYSHTFAPYHNQVRRNCPDICSKPNLIDRLSERHIVGGPIFEGSDAVNNDEKELRRPGRNQPRWAGRFYGSEG